MTDVFEKETECYICNCLDASFAFFNVSVDTRMGPLMKPMQRCDLVSIAALHRCHFCRLISDRFCSRNFTPVSPRASEKKTFNWSHCLNFIINFTNNKLNTKQICFVSLTLPIRFLRGLIHDGHHVGFQNVMQISHVLCQRANIGKKANYWKSARWNIEITLLKVHFRI